MDNIVEKIKKLLALATSSNPHEAALAAAKAQELMVKYAIEETQLTSDKPKETVEVTALGLGMLRIPAWKALLAGIVAPSFFCRAFYAPGRDILVAGRATDKEAFVVTIQFLFDTIERLADRAWTKAKNGTDTHGKAWKASFYEGCCAIIKERLAIAAAREVNSETAIVLANREKAVTDYVNEKIKPKKNLAKRTVGVDGFAEGVRAGMTIPLDKRASKKIGDGGI